MRSSQQSRIDKRQTLQRNGWKKYELCYNLQVQSYAITQIPLGNSAGLHAGHARKVRLLGD
jgi:hypothetical protein